MSAPHRTRGKPRVLVVDDDTDSRELYAEYLGSSGWEVEAVTDGDEALAVAASFGPDVVVMDLAMPALDGFEATRRLKRDARTRDIPVVCVTSYAHREVDALRAGFAVFLSKPCAPSELLGVIEELVRAPAAAEGDA
jgi:CheY-like chemotaxis protein